MALSRMSSSEMRDRLESQHQERVAPKSTKVQMLTCLIELEVEDILEETKQVTTPRQHLIAKVNQAARKKASGSLHLSLTGNETIPILKVKCLNEAYKVAELHESDIMGFGKHAEKSYIEAAQDGNYVEWTKRICAEEATNHLLQRWIRWLSTVKDEDMTLRLQIQKDVKKKATVVAGKKKENSQRGARSWRS